MKELSYKLLELIKERKTVNEISEILSISNKQLFSIITMLQNKGIELNRKYYEDGSILYEQEKKLKLTSYPKEQILITDKKSMQLKSIVLSDLHLASKLERVDLLEKVYNYCIGQNIHIIMNCGDLIDGTLGKAKTDVDVMRQIDDFLKKYPFDQQIINIALLGDHDFSALKEEGIDFEKVLHSYRHDFMTLGYQQGKLKIKNDFLIFSHPNDNVYHLPKEEYQNKKEHILLLEGHHHFMAVKEFSSLTKIFVPSLCSFVNPSFLNRPSVLQLTLHFTSLGYIQTVQIEQLLVEEQFGRINDIYLSVEKGKNTCVQAIENTEDYKKYRKIREERW